MSENTRLVVIALIGAVTTIVVAFLPLWYGFKQLRLQLEQNKAQSEKNAAKIEQVGQAVSDQTQKIDAITDEQIRAAIAAKEGK